MSEGNAVGRFEFAMSWMTGKDKNIENAQEWINKALDVVEGDNIAEKQENIEVLWKKLDSYSGINDDDRFELWRAFAAFVFCRDMKSSAQEDIETVKNFCALLESARKGDPKNQFELAMLYYKGMDGVIEDNRLAVYWFEKAAKQGFAEAQFFMGECYRRGDGVEEDIEEAKEWYQKAADQGNERAKDKLEELS